MKQACCICGKEDEEYFMDRLLTGGHRAKWICPKCRDKGNLEVTKKKRRQFHKEEGET